jgi:phage gpG-like protein
MGMTVTGVEAIQKTVVQLKKAMTPDSEKMSKVATELAAAIDKNFATNGRGSWAPNSPNTREGVGGIFQFTGLARASMQKKVGATFAIVQPSNKVFKYVAVNNFGSKDGRIPARQLMTLYEDDIQNVMNVLEKPIDEALK